MPATQLRPWTPNRYILRENPEPGIATAIYAGLDPDWGPLYIIRPDPENPEQVLLTDPKGFTHYMNPEEAQHQQQKALASINDRFQVSEDGAGNHYTFSIEDLARRGPEGQVHSVANIWRNPHRQRGMG